MPVIYDYVDYRLFLKDFYEESKKANPFFSYKCFADRAGFKTKTFLHRVIRGERALVKSRIFQVATAMKLSKSEIEYFENLVLFTEAKNAGEKEFYFDKMQTNSRRNPVCEIRQNQYHYFSKWYHVVVRELITMNKWKDDYSWLARHVYPRITVPQAKRAVKLLHELGLIKKTSSGYYCQTDTFIKSKDEAGQIGVRVFQKKAMELAQSALDEIPPDQRDISTLTLGVSEEQFTKLKKELRNFRARLLSLCDSQKKLDRVYQLNLAFFPVSEVPKEKNV